MTFNERRIASLGAVVRKKDDIRSKDTSSRYILTCAHGFTNQVKDEDLVGCIVDESSDDKSLAPILIPKDLQRTVEEKDKLDACLIPLPQLKISQCFDNFGWIKYSKLKAEQELTFYGRKAVQKTLKYFKACKFNENIVFIVTTHELQQGDSGGPVLLLKDDVYYLVGILKGDGVLETDTTNSPLNVFTPSSRIKKHFGLLFPKGQHE